MRETKNKKGWIRENAKAILWAAVIAVLIRSLIGAPFNIPSGSMIPSLLIGDYLFASKYSYGYSKHSFPFSFIPFSGRLFYSQPEQGDVVIFRRPQNPGKPYLYRALTSEDYIKRLIGMPGDTIQMKDGRLYINDQLVPRTFKRYETGQNAYGQTAAYTVYDETLPNGVTHEIMELSDEGPADNTPPYHVPENHFFFMGDNRDNSQDSRFDAVGFVPQENLIGKVQFIFTPTTEHLLSWPFGIGGVPFDGTDFLWEFNHDIGRKNRVYFSKQNPFDASFDVGARQQSSCL